MKKKRKKHKIRRFGPLWWAGWTLYAAFVTVGSYVIICGAAAIG